jgi:hypothetical protein
VGIENGIIERRYGGYRLRMPVVNILNGVDDLLAAVVVEFGVTY